MKGLQIRRTALIGPSRVGKTSLIFYNFRGNVLAIDPDNNFGNMASLTAGKEILYLPPMAAINPLDLYNESNRILRSNDSIGTIAVDTVSKIYGMPARMAAMQMRLSGQERKERGLGSNKAADMVDKSDAVSVLAFLAAYGKDIFYTWHVRKGALDMNSSDYGKVDKEVLSDVERTVLMQSIDMILFLENNNGVFSARVGEETRGFGRPPRTGFTYIDPPGNMWRGAMDRLEELIYLYFDNKDDAVLWAAEKLETDNSADLEAALDEVRSNLKPDAKANGMWFSWVTAVHRMQDDRAKTGGKPVEISTTLPPDPQYPPAISIDRAKEQKPVVLETPMSQAVPGDTIKVTVTREEVEPVMTSDTELTQVEVPDEVPESTKLDPAVAQEVADSLTQEDLQYPVTPDEAIAPEEITYRNGDTVAEEDIADFLVYKAKMDRAPYEFQQLHNARTHEANQPWGD